MGTESKWETALVSVEAGVVIVGIGLLFLKVATRTRR
jgi:hypothetical protein